MSNRDLNKIKSPLDTIVKEEEMVRGIVRQKSWINEVFSYSSLYEI